MSMCNRCGHARMLHERGTCGICGVTCNAGYAPVVNAMHPVTPKRVGGAPVTRGRGPGVVKGPEEITDAPTDPRISFVKLARTLMDAADLETLTEILEHRQRHNALGTVDQRLDSVAMTLTHAQAIRYLRELRRRQREGEPPVRHK